MNTARQAASRWSIVAGAASVIWGVLISLSLLWRPAVAAAEPGEDSRVARLIDRLKHGEFEERRRAADALGDLGAAAATAVPALVEAIKDEHVEVHWYALDALGRIGQASATAVPALAGALTNPRSNRYSRRVAARALGRFGPLAADATAALATDLEAEDHELRVESALALWRVSADRRAMDALGRLIEGAKDPAAFHACLALAEIGPEARECIPTLLAVLASSDADVRRAAARALGSLGPEALQPLVEKLAIRPPALDADARGSAVDALGAIADEVRRSTFDRAGAGAEQIATATAPFEQSVIPVLAQLLNSDEPAVGQHAARALAAVGLPAVPVLADALGSNQPSVRHAAELAFDAVQQALPEAAEVRSRFRPQLLSAVPALNRALAGDRAAQQAAARAYALLPIPGTAETVDRLRDVIKTDDLATRHYAAQALTRFENQGQAR